MKTASVRWLLPLAAAAVALLAGGCFFAAPVPPESPQLEKIGFRADEKGTFRRSSDHSAIQLEAEKRSVTLNGRQWMLPHPVEMPVPGKLYLSELDMQKVILPLFSKPSPRPKRKITTILLDAGHGGADRGAAGKKFTEKDLNLKLALQLGRALAAKGYQVRYTRKDDRALTLIERGELCRRCRAELFLSIHHNASLNPETAGTECYVVTPCGSASSNDDAKAIHHTAVPGNRFDQENVFLAHFLQSAMLRATGHNDRGIRFARFKVLTLAECPAALLEIGFITNPEEERHCAKTDVRRKLASALADAVERFDRFGR